MLLRTPPPGTEDTRQFKLKLMVNNPTKHFPENVHEGNGENELGTVA